MENLSYDALVDMITKEVLKVLSDNKIVSDACGKIDSRPLALLIGEKEKLPSFAAEKYKFAPLDDYKGDITCFECVFIAKLSFSQLADCALGRDSCAASCAVIQALLNGKKVYLLESALPHRAYRETADRKFYAMLEGYVNTLRSFGVEFIREQWFGKNLNKDAIEDNTADKVITEKIAVALCEKCSGGIVKLRKGTVITPSAKDIFNHSEIKVEFVD